MALERITYTDKIALQNQEGIASVNKIADNDMNQIKSVVNATCTQVDENTGNLDVISDRVTDLETKTTVKAIIDVVYPIGSIYISYSSTNPGTTWPGTTWTRESAGRCIMGIGSNGTTSYTIAGTTGGVETVTLSTTQMPSHTHIFTGSVLGTHNHTQNAHNHGQDAHSHVFNRPKWYNSDGGSNNGGIFSQQSTTWQSFQEGVSPAQPGIWNNTATNNAASAGTPSGTNSSTGGGGAHTNLQPYVILYIWRRTA